MKVKLRKYICPTCGRTLLLAALCGKIVVKCKRCQQLAEFNSERVQPTNPQP